MPIEAWGLGNMDFGGKQAFPLGGMGGKEDGKEGEGPKKKVPFFKLFAFADFYDYVLMAIGSLGACVHGASVPVFFIFFGKLINIIGIAYLFPASVSHRVAKVSFHRIR